MTDRVLLEDGTVLLNEAGGASLLERAAPDGNGLLLTESGFHLLLESGDKIELEAFVPVTPPTPPTVTETPGSGPKHGVHPDTARYWESERARLAAIRDDDEVLMLT